MKNLTIKSNFFNYKVNFLQTNSFSKTLKKELRKSDVIILDKNVYKIYKKYFGKSIFKHLVIIDAAEKHKSFQYLNSIYKDLLRKNVTRKSRLIAIGGGIIQDIVCFISSTLFRGIEWIFFPTTLLAQADSCIGSKSSINFEQYKNLIGTYYPPSKIYIDDFFLNSLSLNEIRSGVGEIIKVYLIVRSNEITDLNQIIINEFKDLNQLKKHIYQSLKIKKLIIEEDEFDQRKRKILNYGHSFGHAIETATNYKIPHGVAVTIGMNIANYISKEIGNISDTRYQFYQKILSNNANHFFRYKINYKKIIEALKKDKKNINSKIFNLILWKNNKNLGVLSIPNNQTFSKYLKKYFNQNK